MCVFLRTADKQVDIFWINQTVLLTPEGIDGDPEIRVIINGLVQPKEGSNDVAVNFVHAGEIYHLEDWSSEWLRAGEEPNKDWLSSNIFNNSRLNDIPRIERHDADKLRVRIKDKPKGNDDYIIATVTDKQNVLSGDVYCSGVKEGLKYSISTKPAAKVDYTPIYSAFTLSLKSSNPNPQLFRITFCTKSGVHPYHSQINVDVEGPDTLLNSIKRDIDNKVADQNQRDTLRQPIDTLSTYGEERDLEIALVSHPTMSLMIERATNAASGELCKEFPLESTGTIIKSAECEGRVVFYGGNNRNAIIKAITSPVAEHRRQHSPEFLEMLTDLKRELEKG
jgi:hypothetical protein